MADLFVLILLPLVLTDPKAVDVVADEEVVAVDEVALNVEDEVVDVALVVDEVVDVEVLLEVAVAEAPTVGALEISRAKSRLSKGIAKACQLTLPHKISLRSKC